VNHDSDSGGNAPESDEALVRSVANGDTRALAALYDRHAPLMLVLARRIVLGTSEAEDIVHDVFVEAWRRAADYDETRGSVKAWLLLRTRSRSIDFRKSAAVSRTVPTGDGDWLAALADARAVDSEAPDRARLRQLGCELNDQCTQDEQCASGKCLLGIAVCSVPCTQSKGCPANTYCAETCSVKPCISVCLPECLGKNASYCSSLGPWTCKKTQNTEGIEVSLCQP